MAKISGFWTSYGVRLNTIWYTNVVLQLCT